MRFILWTELIAGSIVLTIMIFRHFRRERLRRLRIMNICKFPIDDSIDRRIEDGAVTTSKINSGAITSERYSKEALNAISTINIKPLLKGSDIQ